MDKHKCHKNEDIEQIKDHVSEMNAKLELIYSKLMEHNGFFEQFLELKGALKFTQVLLGTGFVGSIIIALLVVKLT